jgi:hypothetical protein
MLCLLNMLFNRVVYKLLGVPAADGQQYIRMQTRAPNAWGMLLIELVVHAISYMRLHREVAQHDVLELLVSSELWLR